MSGRKECSQKIPGVFDSARDRSPVAHDDPPTLVVFIHWGCRTAQECSSEDTQTVTPLPAAPATARIAWAGQQGDALHAYLAAVVLVNDAKSLTLQQGPKKPPFLAMDPSILFALNWNSQGQNWRRKA